MKKNKDAWKKIDDLIYRAYGSTLKKLPVELSFFKELLKGMTDEEIRVIRKTRKIIYRNFEITIVRE